MHCDNGHLFPHSEEHVRTPHCVTVICPLIDVTEDNGPTEFWPGSHYEAVAKEMFEERARTGAHIPSKSSLQLAGAVGDCILFDTRTVFAARIMSLMNRGDAAAGTWIFRGDESRRAAVGS